MDEKNIPNQIYMIEPNNTLDQKDYSLEDSMMKTLWHHVQLLPHNF
jgi:hypothetical protein